MRQLVVFIICFLLSLASSDRGFADDRLERIKERSQPLAQHQALSRYAGPWKIRAKAWPSDSQNPERFSGTANNRMILGDRYLEFRVLSRNLTETFEAQALLGFDPTTNTYSLTWFSTHQLAPLILSGELRDKAYHFSGVALDPLENRKYPVRLTLTADEEEQFSMTMSVSKNTDTFRKVFQFSFRPSSE